MTNDRLAQSSFISRWTLDSPKSDDLFENAGGGKYKLRGWALGLPGKPLSLAVRQYGVTRCYPFNRNREDVIKVILNEEPNGHPQLLCGFEYTLPFGAPVEFGFACNAQLVWLKVLNPADVAVLK